MCYYLHVRMENLSYIYFFWISSIWTSYRQSFKWKIQNSYIYSIYLLQPAILTAIQPASNYKDNITFMSDSSNNNNNSNNKYNNKSTIQQKSYKMKNYNKRTDQLCKTMKTTATHQLEQEKKQQRQQSQKFSLVFFFYCFFNYLHIYMSM